MARPPFTTRCRCGDRAIYHPGTGARKGPETALSETASTLAPIGAGGAAHALPTAMEVAERIRTSVMGRDVSIRSTGKSLGRVTISIGAAQLLPSEEPLAWLDRADSYLYAAKRDGRNKVVGTA